MNRRAPGLGRMLADSTKTRIGGDPRSAGFCESIFMNVSPPVHHARGMLMAMTRTPEHNGPVNDELLREQLAARRGSVQGESLAEGLAGRIDKWKRTPSNTRPRREQPPA